MFYAPSRSYDYLPDTNATIRRWSNIAIPWLLFLILGNHSPTESLVIGVVFGLIVSGFVWLFTHPLKPFLVRYTRAFESHSPTLVWTLAMTFVFSGLLLLSMTGFIIFHPGFHWYDLPLHLRIPSWIAIVLFFISSFELAYCEHMHQKRVRRTD